MRSLATSRMAGSPSGPSTANISRTLPEPRWVRPENEEAASGTSPNYPLPREPLETPGSTLRVARHVPAPQSQRRGQEAHARVTEQLRVVPEPEYVARREGVRVGLGEADVARRPDDDAVLHHEHPVAGQARHRQRPWVEHAGVPEVVHHQRAPEPPEQLVL